MQDIAKITSLESLTVFTEHFSLLTSVFETSICVSYLLVRFVELRMWLYGALSELCHLPFSQLLLLYTIAL
jgi:hypothetical protein